MPLACETFVAAARAALNGRRRIKLYIAVRIPYVARSGGPEVERSAANAGLG